VHHAHGVDHINAAGLRDNQAGQDKNRQSPQTEAVAPETIQQAADKQLRDAVADEENTKRELYLQTPYGQLRSHRRQRRQINIGGEPGQGDERESQDGGDGVMLFFDAFGKGHAAKIRTAVFSTVTGKA